MSAGVSSIILFKFRSNPNFEPLHLPGTSARLFDVKRGIVRAKKLDCGGTPEFDLSVKNAATNEEYLDESMLLPRGTRVIVQRRPAVSGRGLLARITQSETGGVSSSVMNTSNNSHSNSNYYTINIRDRDEEDEFVDNDEEDESSKLQSEAPPEEETELAALKAVMDEGSNLYRPGGAIGNKTWTMGGGSMPAGSGMPQKQPHYQRHQKHHVRPNADPELREQEQRQQPKKRATGIPRTFLQFETGTNADNDENEAGLNDDKTMDVAGGGLARIQPSTAGFAELIAHKGGQSSGHPTRSIDYALKITSTVIPKNLQCGICSGLVKNAMFLHWDEEGRTACETCIRDALTDNGFRCPLTGKEGVSPDELFPHHQLRKEADKFVIIVMQKIELIEREHHREEEEAKKEEEKKFFEGDAGDKGIIISKKRGRETKSGKEGNDLLSDDDDDDFGGDVFDVSKDEVPESEDENINESEEQAEKKDVAVDKSYNILTTKNVDPITKTSISDINKNLNPILDSKMNNEVQSETKIENTNEGAGIESANVIVSNTNLSNQSKYPPAKKVRRGPPAGYALGPAGGAAVTPTIPPPFPPPPGGPNLPPPPPIPPPPPPIHPNMFGGRGNAQGGRGTAHQNNFNNNYNHQQDFHGGRGRGRGGGRGRSYYHRGGSDFDMHGRGRFGGPPPPYGMNPGGGNNSQRHPNHNNQSNTKKNERNDKNDENQSQQSGGKDGPPQQYNEERERYDEGAGSNGRRHHNQRNNFPHNGGGRHRSDRVDHSRRFDDGGRWGNQRRGDGGRWDGHMGNHGRDDGGRWGGRFRDGGRWGGGRGGRSGGRGFQGGRGHFRGRGRY